MKKLSNTCEMFVGMMLNQFAYSTNSERSLKSLLAETKRRVRLATNISQVFE